MLSFTLDTLKTAIKNHVEDQGSNFDGNLDTLIQKGEEKVYKDLPLEIWKATDNLTVTKGDRKVAKPSGYLVHDSLSYVVDGTRYFLEERTYQYCLDYAPGVTTEGKPKFFAELDEDNFYLVPTPDEDTEIAGIDIRFTKKPTSLVVDTDGTWMSKNLGDLLLEACLVCADEFGMVREQEGLGDRLKEYQRLLAAARFRFRHMLAREYAPLGAQPSAQGEG